MRYPSCKQVLLISRPYREKFGHSVGVWSLKIIKFVLFVLADASKITSYLMHLKVNFASSVLYLWLFLG